MPLSDIQIRGTKLSASRTVKLSDGGGLQLWVTPAGSKLWNLAYRYDGRQRKLSLGPYPRVGLKEARTGREKAKALLASGVDPRPGIARAPSSGKGSSELERALDTEGTMTKRPQKDGPRWHLGVNASELALADFQHALICLSEAFYRYVGRSLSQIAKDGRLTGEDAVILNVIRSGLMPKTIADIQHFTNRGDLSNVLYSVRKLEKAGLVRRVPRSKVRGISYCLTADGEAVTDRYIETRREMLASFISDGEALSDRLRGAKDIMVLLTGLYDQAARKLLATG